MNDHPLSFCMLLCSRRRPALVTQALNSIASLEIPSGVQFSVLLVENDTVPQYANIVADFKGKLTIRYESEPEPGLTHVRNHALNTAEKLGVNWIGSIDDDVVVPKDWLVHMVAAIRTYADTQIFYGNWIRHTHPDEAKWHPRQHHLNPHPTGQKIKASSFNNVAIRADVYAQNGMALRLDHRFRFIGGEDADFTRTYLKRGGIIRSVQGALAEEYNTPERATFANRLYRTIATEYASVTIHHKHDPAIIAILWSLQTVYRGLVLGMIYIALGAVLFLFDKQWGRKRYSIGRLLIARAAGVLRYYFGSPPELYRDEGDDKNARTNAIPPSG